MRFETAVGLVGLCIGLLGCASESPQGDFSELPANSSAVSGQTAGGQDTVAGATAPDTGAGAVTNPGRTSETFSVGDAITVSYADTPQPILPSVDRVKEDGTITLLYNKVFVAVNKSRSELEKEIRATYVPSYFQNLTVSVQPVERFIYVDGEVKAPNKLIYTPKTTVMQAIQSCGGFTDFAKRTKVQLTRKSGEKFIINCAKVLKDARYDMEILAGDSIHVPRTIL